MIEVSQKIKRMVVSEALKLRKYASNEEKARLNPNTVTGTSQTQCLYGQMTGYCHSTQSIALLAKCAVPFIESGNWRGPKPPLIKGKKRFSRSKRGQFQKSYFSVIEFYLVVQKDESKIHDLINLIKS